MTFAAPQFLFLAIVLVPLAIAFLISAERARRKALAKVGQPSLIARLGASVNLRGRYLKYVLWTAALTLLLVALARPQWGETKSDAPQKGIQVMVALDVSESMMAQDLQPNRLERAKLEISDLMNHLHGDEIGLVPFSGASFILFPLTSDYNTARSFLDTAKPGIVSRGGTDINNAITTAMSGFDPHRDSQKVIVIVTDGEDTMSNALTAAQDAAKQGVMIYTIGLGSPNGDTIPEYDGSGKQTGVKKDQQGNVVHSKLDAPALTAIANATGGKYFQATPAGTELNALGDQLDSLKKGDITNHETVTKFEQFQWFLLPALALLLIAELIPERKSNSRFNRWLAQVSFRRADKSNTPASDSAAS